LYVAFVFVKKQLSTICMYINVIYFFVTCETFVHTVFEPLAKKTSSLLFTLHEERSSPSIETILNIMSWLLCNYNVDEVTIPIYIYIPKAYFVLLVHSFMSRHVYSKEQFSFSTAFVDVDDVYAQIIKEKPRLCVPLGMTLESLHLLLRCFSSAFP
jgi:hypothetical protein